jgi:3-dehydroquinate dehydratase/shikimate dehydrogenase
MSIITTERLILRPWRSEDLEPFAQLNADPRVMEYFPSTLSREESDRLAESNRSELLHEGWGKWAVSVPGAADFIGYIGLARVEYPCPFAPTVEIGWRLAYDYWSKGYATEGAKAAIKYGFDKVNLTEIVSFTTVQNKRSQRIMEKLGMHHAPEDDFDHPKLPEGHPLRRHVLYRLKLIQLMTAQDIPKLYKAFSAPPYNKLSTVFEDYFDQQQRVLRELYLASVNETIIGYVTLIWDSPYPPFAKAKIPEIKDLNVIVESRSQGYGTRLIKHAEERARAAGHKIIGIGTELTPDYDAARRLYPALGYVPDGRGETEGVVYLTKKL